MRLPGIDVQLHDEEHTLLGSTFYVSGFIPRVTPYEQGNPNHASQWVGEAGQADACGFSRSPAWPLASCNRAGN